MPPIAKNDYLRLVSSKGDRSPQKTSVESIQSQQTPGADLSFEQGSSALVDVIADEICLFVQDFVDMEEAKQAREIRANHRSITGWLQASDKSIPFESSLERDFGYLALFDLRVRRVCSQPVAITYTDPEGKSRHYTPDFQVTYFHSPYGEVDALVEVKPSSEFSSMGGLDNSKFVAAKSWCEEHGMAFHVLTENEIRGQHLDNVRALYPFRLSHPDEDMSVTMHVWSFARENSGMMIGKILEACSSAEISSSDVQRSLWCLIATRQLFCDLSQPLTANLEVFLEPVWNDPKLFFTRD